LNWKFCFENHRPIFANLSRLIWVTASSAISALIPPPFLLRDLNAVCGKLPPDVMWVRVEARDGGESELDAEGSAVAVIGDVSVFEALGGDLRELGFNWTEEGVKGEATNAHDRGFFESDVKGRRRC
jgi:hypothetical protein